MKPGRMLVTDLSDITFAGCTWSVIFDLHALLKLGTHLDPEIGGLEWLRPAMERLVAGDINTMAAFLWAGLLREDPRLTPSDALSLLDEASMIDLGRLPEQLLRTVQEAMGAPSEGGGEPWDWELALAAWVKEWGRSEAEFWATTLRTFSAISNGLSKLYKSSERSQGGKPEGFSLEQLLGMRKGRPR